MQMMLNFALHFLLQTQILAYQNLNPVYHPFILCSLTMVPLYSTKSEAILFGTQQRLHHFPSIPSITTLGVTLDSTLSFNSHVSNVCEASYSHLQALKHIRPILTKDIALSIAVALVQSRIFYANSVLYRTSSHNINKLQRVQTMAARRVVGNRQIPATDLLSDLHWLPVTRRIPFKTATLTYKVLNTQQPAYLRSLINYQLPACEL